VGFLLSSHSVSLQRNLVFICKPLKGKFKMASNAQTAQGLALAIFGAPAGGYSNYLVSKAGDARALSSELVTELGKLGTTLTVEGILANLNLKSGSSAYLATKDLIDVQIAGGAKIADAAASVVTYMFGLTDSASPLYETAQAFQKRVDVAIEWSNGVGSSETDVKKLIAQQAKVDAEVTPPPTPEAETVTLKAAVETVTGGAGNDSIKGVVSSLAKENTLNSTDVINGGAGTDTLSLTIQSDFAGFATGGQLVGVETVSLTSDSNVARTFNPKGIKDVTTYSIDATKAAINLKDASLGATINLSNQKSGDFKVEYATAVTGGIADAQALGLTKVGTAKTTTAAAKPVTVIIADVETLNLSATGTNVVDFTAAASKTVNVSGDGSLEVALVPAGMTKFDASTATGKLSIDLISATDASSVKLGGGDDTLTAAIADDVSSTAVISGGAGADTLVLKGGSGAANYNMSGVETLQLKSTDGALTFNGKNTTGLTTVVATNVTTTSSSPINQSATFVNMGDNALTFNLRGEGGANSPVLSSDHTGVTTVTVNTPATGASTTNDVDVTVNKSSQVDVSVAAKLNYTGTITANAASEINLALDGKVTAATLKSTAPGLEITVTGVSSASSVTLNTPKATSLDVSGIASLDVTGSTLTALSTLNVQSDTGGFTAGALKSINTVEIDTLTGVTLGALGSSTLGYDITVNATISDGNLTIGDLTTKDNEINVNASGVSGDITLGDVDAGEGGFTVDLSNTSGALTIGDVDADAVEINSSGSTGVSTYGNILAGSSVVFAGGDVANTLQITAAVGSAALALDLTGGSEDDSIFVIAAAVGTKITVTGTLGDAAIANSIDINGAAGNDTVDVSDLEIQAGASSAGADIDGGAGIDTIIGSDFNDTITGGSGNDKLTGGAGDDTFVFSGVTTALNGSDSISDFKVGDDVIDVGALTATVLSAGAISLATAVALTDATTPIAVVDTETYVAQVATIASIDSAAEVKTALLTGALDALLFDALGTAYLVLSGSDNTKKFFVYGVTATSLQAVDTVILVGTITSDSITLTADNFS
jgi:hypothetical protein